MRKTLIIILSCFFLVSCSSFNGDTEKGRKAFIHSYGWEISGDCTEQCEIKIPENLNKIYEGYNNIQKEAGMDLAPYLGKDAERYTYMVTNHPLSDDGGVRINLLVCDGIIIAADIMNPSLYGFIRPINSDPHEFMQ